MLRTAHGASVTAMSDAETVTFYMEPELCASAQASKLNFIGKVVRVLIQSGLDVAYEPFG